MILNSERSSDKKSQSFMRLEQCNFNFMFDINSLGSTQHFFSKLAFFFNEAQNSQTLTLAKNANLEKIWRQFIPHKKQTTRKKNCGGECLFMKGWQRNKHIADSHSQSSIFHSTLLRIFLVNFVASEPRLSLR